MKSAYQILRKPVITENRAGAQGLLGTEAVAHAKPDGYTISINPIASTMAAARFNSFLAGMLADMRRSLL